MLSVRVRSIVSAALMATGGTLVTGLAGVRPAGAAASLVASSISIGDQHTCAVTTTGAAKCWGSNEFGQLGDGTATNRLTPVTVRGLAGGVKYIDAGYRHTCAVTIAGAAKCWGYNDYGALGDGTQTDRWTPVTVRGLASGVKYIVAGSDNTCAVTIAGAAKCWGDNEFGQLGDGTQYEEHTPVSVWGLASGVNFIANGFMHTCAVTTAGAAKCWGRNLYGELGDGTQTDRWTPVSVWGLASGVKYIDVGSGYTCAVTTAGAAKCWGGNGWGALGDGTTTGRLTPVTVRGLASGVRTINAGFAHTCAVTTTGAAKCWGGNLHGQLGDGTRTRRLTPVSVSGLASGVAGIMAGYAHTCARTTARTVKCWGYNGDGQLGDGTTPDRLTPVTVLLGS